MRVLLAAVLLVLVTATGAHADPPLPPQLEPVPGATTGKAAPTITTGRYVDHTRAKGVPNIYEIDRTIPGSTILFGATLLTQDGFLKRNRLAVVLAYPDKGIADGIVRCGSNAPLDEERPASMPIATHAGFSFGYRECATKTQLFLTVRANPSAKVPVGSPYELDVWEVPPVTNGKTLPEPAGVSSDTVVPTEPTVRATPGPWLAQATRLTAGTTAYVDLPLGRVAWFAVDVPFNDLLDAIATVSDPAGTSAGSSVEVQLVSPVGGIVSVPPLDAAPLKQTATLGSGSVSVEAATALVNPRARLDSRNNGFEGETTLSSQPGWYAIAVFVPNITGDASATLPMTLTAGLRRGTGFFAHGDAAPTYDGTLTAFPPPEGVGETAYSRLIPGAVAVPVSGLAYGLLGAAALLVLVGAGALVRSGASRGRRRTGRSR